MPRQDQDLQRLLQLIEEYARAGRWDGVQRLVHRGLDEYRGSADPDVRRLCFWAARWYLVQVADLDALRTALASARDLIGSDLDDRLDLQVGTTYLLLNHRSAAGYAQVAGWLRGNLVARPDLSLLVLDQAQRWDPTNPVVDVVRAAAHLDLGNLTDAEASLQRARERGASSTPVTALELRMARLIGKEVPEDAWDQLHFEARGHRQKGYAVVEFLMGEGSLREALTVAGRLDAERSTIRTRHLIRQIRRLLGKDMPEAG